MGQSHSLLSLPYQNCYSPSVFVAAVAATHHKDKQKKEVLKNISVVTRFEVHGVLRGVKSAVQFYCVSGSSSSLYCMLQE